MSEPNPELDVLSDYSTTVLGLVIATPTIGVYDELKGESVADPLEGSYTFTNAQIKSFNKDGDKEITFFDDFYFRVHLTPATLNLGNILSVQSRSVYLWNANFVTQQVSSFTGTNEPGLSIQEPDSTPYNLLPLDLSEYIFTVDVVGSPQFDTTVTWTVDGEQIMLPVTGRRVILFPFEPNWSSSVIETLEWKTNIFVSYDGTEQRSQIRSKPRLTLSYSTMTKGAEARQFRNLMYGWQHRQYAVPMWYDVVVMTGGVNQGATTIGLNTENIGFQVGGLAVLFSDFETFEVFEIESITPISLVTTRPLEFSWPIGTKVYPVNQALISKNLPTTSPIASVKLADIEFRMSPTDSTPFVPDAPAPVELGSYEYILNTPNWGVDVTDEYARDYGELDNITGALQQIQHPDFSKNLFTYQWMLKGKSEIKEFREMLQRCKGMLKPVYLPTWFQDFTLYEKIQAGSSSIRIVKQRYEEMVGNSVIQNAIVIRKRMGGYYTRVISGVSSTDDYEVISFNDVIPEEILIDQVATISIVRLMRLAADQVTIEYLNATLALVQPTFITVRE